MADAQNRFRPQYRELSETEKALIGQVKDSAAVVESYINFMKDSREKSLALTKLEESVMWAVKGLTG